MNLRTNKTTLNLYCILSILGLCIATFNLPTVFMVLLAVVVITLPFILNALDLDKPTLEIDVEDAKKLISIMNTSYCDFSSSEQESLSRILDKLKEKL